MSASDSRPDPIKPHAIWRRKRDGRLVRVLRVQNVANSYSEPYFDVQWEATGEGWPRPRRGACFEDYWRRDYELTEEHVDA